MKRVLILLSLSLIAWSAAASDLPTRGDSWERILNNRSVRAFVPSVMLQHAYGSKAFSVMDVCINNDHLALKTESTTICRYPNDSIYPGKKPDPRCVPTQVSPSAPLVTTESVCVKYDNLPKGQRRCSAWESREVRFPESFDIAVSKLVYSKPTGPVGVPPTDIGPTIFTKEYTVPQCN